MGDRGKSETKAPRVLLEMVRRKSSAMSGERGKASGRRGQHRRRRGFKTIADWNSK